MPPSLVVFTDLDGTLLRHEDYAWEPAREALEALRRNGIPLVIATSKTREEIEAIRDRLGNRDPFISENGGALFVPRDAPPRRLVGAVERDGYRIVELGTPYPRLREALRAIERALGVPLRGFGDLDATAVARETGLPVDQAALALRREYDEPFLVDRPLGEDGERRLAALAGEAGLRVTRGGRFHHLLGAGSKGEAARRLLDAHAAGGRRPVSMALGDGGNDLELLQAVDEPVVVARPDGSHAPALREGVPHARFTRGAGPEGFREAVLDRLRARSGASPGGAGQPG